MSYPTKLTGIFVLVVAALLALTGFISADEYIIGPGDVLQVSFWQDPGLNQVVAVRQDGKITLSIIGEITAAGLTSRELSEKVESNVSLYYKKISQAAVTVVGFNSQKIFISGNVLNTGKMTFEVIPDLWTVIKEAGGVTETGDLTRVTIIRSDESGGERITVNLLEAIQDGSIARLPGLKAGDTIEVPRMAGGAPGRQLTADYSERKNLFYIQGHVRMPGTMPFEEGLDLFDALGAAGGITEMADLKNVRIISKVGDGSSVIKVNLNKYRDEGQARRIIIRPEDTIIISARKQGILSWGQLRDFAAVAGTIISFVYLIDRR